MWGSYSNIGIMDAPLFGSWVFFLEGNALEGEREELGETMNAAPFCQ